MELRLTEHDDIESTISRYLDDELDEEAFAVLEAWVNQSRENALAFVRQAFNSYRLRYCFVKQELSKFTSQLADRSSQESGQFLAELMQIEARLQAELVDVTDQLEAQKKGALHKTLADRQGARRTTQKTIVIPWSFVYAAAAVLILSAVGLLYQFTQTQPGRNNHADQPQAPTQERPELLAVLYQKHPETGLTFGQGQDLYPGDRARASDSGSVLQFLSGAVVQLEPSSQMVVTGHNQCDLSLGDLTVNVPPAASGFEVLVPGGLVRDIGTEFSVSVDPSGVSHISVLSGEVTLHKRTGDGRVLAGHALIENERGVVDPSADLLGIIQESLLPLKSTGAATATGLPDPHWSVVRISGDPAFKPGRAVVIAGDAGDRAIDWEPNTARSAWIKQPGQADPVVPEGQLTTYRHRFDVPQGTDLSSIVMRARVWVDDYLAAATINGLSVLGSTHPLTKGAHYGEPAHLIINRGFKHGENVLELTVANDHAEDRPRSPSGLRVLFSPVPVRIINALEPSSSSP